MPTCFMMTRSLRRKAAKMKLPLTTYTTTTMRTTPRQTKAMIKLFCGDRH